MSWRLEWDDKSTTVPSVEELDRLLDELAANANGKALMVELRSPIGETLAIGLGRGESVLSWVQASTDPPYYASLGDPDADGTMVFYYRREWSEFPRWGIIPASAGRAAMHEFFASGSLPDNVLWREV